MSRNDIPEDIPHGHERSYRRGKGEAIALDRRSLPSKPERPKDLPEGHGRSYERGFEDGIKESKGE